MGGLGDLGGDSRHTLPFPPRSSIPAKAGISRGGIVRHASPQAILCFRFAEFPAKAGRDSRASGNGMRGEWGDLGGCSTPQNRQRRFYPPPQAAGGENKRRGAKKSPQRGGFWGDMGGLDVQGDAETDGHSFGRDAEKFGHFRNVNAVVAFGVVVYRLVGHQDFRPQLIGFHFQFVGEAAPEQDVFGVFLAQIRPVQKVVRQLVGRQ